MMDAVIRVAVAEDLQSVSALAQRWAGSGETRGYEAPQQELLEQAFGECFFVAEVDGRVVGFLWGRVKRDAAHAAIVPETEGHLEIEDAYVAPEHRSRGIGSRLVHHARAWAKEAGVRVIVVYSSTRDTDAVTRFYRRCGFETWAVQLFVDLGGRGGWDEEAERLPEHGEDEPTPTRFDEQ